VSTQRRRWRAHLQTRSEDFDRTLFTLMTNQLAAHDALDQVVAGTWLEEQRDAAAGFVSSEVLPAVSSSPPRQIVDMAASSSHHTSYLLGSREPQSIDCAYQVPMASVNGDIPDKQSMSSHDLAWLDTSRLTSLPTNFAPQTLYSPIWTPTSASNFPTSPSQRADPAIDHPYTPNINYNNFQQTASHHQSPEHMFNNTSLSLTPTLFPGNHQTPTGNPYNLGPGPLPAPLPRHDFADCRGRYSYNPNGKPKSTPSSWISSPSIRHTPRKSLSLSS
jgi:hypothetical protein